MRRLVLAEIRKLTTTKTLALVTIGMAGLAALLTVSAQAGTFPAGRPLENPVILSIPAYTLLFPLLLGLRGFTDEFHYRTITPTLVAAPRRGRLFAAKALVTGLAGAAMMAVSLAATLGVAALLARTEGSAVAMNAGRSAAIAGGSVTAAFLIAVLGVGVGAAVRSQVVAVLGGVVWFLAIDLVLAAALGDLGAYLPGQAAFALAHVERADLLAPATAGIVFALYTLTAWGIGALVFRRADIG